MIKKKKTIWSYFLTQLPKFFFTTFLFLLLHSLISFFSSFFVHSRITYDLAVHVSPLFIFFILSKYPRALCSFRVFLRTSAHARSCGSSSLCKNFLESCRQGKFIYSTTSIFCSFIVLRCGSIFLSLFLSLSPV